MMVCCMDNHMGYASGWVKEIESNCDEVNWRRIKWAERHLKRVSCTRGVRAFRCIR